MKSETLAHPPVCLSLTIVLPLVGLQDYYLGQVSYSHRMGTEHAVEHS